MQSGNEHEIAMAVVRFLLDRVDEDETEHERAARRFGSGPGPDIASTGSARNRGENLAKRRVIGELQQLLVLRDLPAESVVRRIALSSLCAMTIPYAGHPRWDAMWELHITQDDAA